MHGPIKQVSSSWSTFIQLFKQNKQICPAINMFLAQTVKILHSTKQEKTDLNSTNRPFFLIT